MMGRVDWNRNETDYIIEGTGADYIRLQKAKDRLKITPEMIDKIAISNHHTRTKKYNKVMIALLSVIAIVELTRLFMDYIYWMI
jgi:hypothetical protein